MTLFKRIQLQNYLTVIQSIWGLLIRLRLISLLYAYLDLIYFLAGLTPVGTLNVGTYNLDLYNYRGTSGETTLSIERQSFMYINGVTVQTFMGSKWAISRSSNISRFSMHCCIKLLLSILLISENRHAEFYSNHSFYSTITFTKEMIQSMLLIDYRYTDDCDAVW